MKAKPTPGTWRADYHPRYHDSIAILAERPRHDAHGHCIGWDADIVAEIRAGMNNNTDDDGPAALDEIRRLWADAHLMAAAPDLLQAVATLLDDPGIEAIDQVKRGWAREALRRAREGKAR